MIGRTFDVSQPARPAPNRANEGAANVLFIELDDTGFGRLFMYFCPGAMHAPHHVPKEWADKYKAGSMRVGTRIVSASSKSWRPITLEAGFRPSVK